MTRNAAVGHDTLRGIIQESVASMVWRKLLSRFEAGTPRDFPDRTVGEFVVALLRPGTRIRALLARLREGLPSGHSDLDIVLFIEAVARRLGEMWKDDSCDLVDVAIGSARLQELIHVLSIEFGTFQCDGHRPHALVLVPKGEQHTLMQHLLGLLFDSLGWSRCVLDGEASPALLRSQISRSEVICIGWSNVRLVAEMTGLVTEIRQHAGDRKLPILVGGIAALDSVDLLVEMGVDCICDSVYSAARICERYRDLTKISQQVRAVERTANVRLDASERPTS